MNSYLSIFTWVKIHISNTRVFTQIITQRKQFLILLPEFNLPLIGCFTWLTPSGPYRDTTCQRREIISGSRNTFLTTQGHGGTPWMSVQLNAGATSETAQTWKTIHSRHTLIHSNKMNLKWWLWQPNDIWGPCGLKFPDICLTGEEKPRKNLTQETCPELGSNLGLLHDRCTCYCLLHSSGLETICFSLNSVLSFKHSFFLLSEPSKLISTNLNRPGMA